MIAIVVGRAATLRSADRLADRFAKEPGRTYLVERIARADFERRPFAVLLHEADGSPAALASLEVYRVTSQGLRLRWHDDAPSAPQGREPSPAKPGDPYPHPLDLLADE